MHREGERKAWMNLEYNSDFKTSPPSEAYMRQWKWTEWAMVQVMVCRLFGAMINYVQPVLTNCQLGP